MQIPFHKYHGTGNDFILIDNRQSNFSQLTQTQIEALCDRHFGIGADGLMLLQDSDTAQFEMKYFNSDGHQSSMCGNGGRCITAFARDLGIVKDKSIFMAIDGKHESTIEEQYVELKMNNVHQISNDGDAFVVETGSPHYVKFVEQVKAIDINKEGRLIRNSAAYADKGINVNFIQMLADKTLMVATYERGVENETLSCGTGVVASALVLIKDKIGGNYVRVSTKGGTLMVKCINQNRVDFTDIYLCGNATKVFEGVINI
jgi:diaminopimelate epimerase